MSARDAWGAETAVLAVLRNPGRPARGLGTLTSWTDRKLPQDSF